MKTSDLDVLATVYIKEGKILIYVTGWAPEPVEITFNNCFHHVTVQNLKLYYMDGLGIVSQLSENICINRVDVIPPPGPKRIIAAFADCFHFSDCYGLVKIENCLISGTHDGPINIHGTYLRIMKADSSKVIVRFMQK